jgi:hypothetical protein
MSCDACKELTVEHQISSPSDLRQAIGIIQGNIADGTIKESPSASLTYSSVPFQDLVNGDNWDDFVSYDFKCTRCGQAFHLRAETYHGSGGAWRPVS